MVNMNKDLQARYDLLRNKYKDKIDRTAEFDFSLDNDKLIIEAKADAVTKQVTLNNPCSVEEIETAISELKESMIDDNPVIIKAKARVEENTLRNPGFGSRR